MHRTIAVLKMNVWMHVFHCAMRVFVGMNAVLFEDVNSPQANRHQGYSDDPFGPFRQGFERKEIAEDQSQQTHQQHPAGMADSPTESKRRAAPFARRERCNGRQMIGTRDHMNCSCKKT